MSVISRGAVWGFEPNTTANPRKNTIQPRYVVSGIVMVLSVYSRVNSHCKKAMIQPNNVTSHWRSAGIGMMGLLSVLGEQR